MDKEQEGYRSYLLDRLVPAMAEFYEDSHDDQAEVGRIPAVDLLEPGDISQRLVSLTTRQLERRLAKFYNDQYFVRTKNRLGASVLGNTICQSCSNRVHLRGAPGSVSLAFCLLVQRRWQPCIRGLCICQMFSLAPGE